MPTIYLDMDGVLADFNTAARQYLNASREDEQDAEQNGRWPEKSWHRLVDAPHFYRHLPKMPLADELVKLAYRFRDELGWDVKILTAIPTKNEVPDVFQDKFDWIAEYYPGIRICFGPYSYDKYRHARPGDILVDDRASNCEEWAETGATAVRVLSQNYQGALDQLADLLAEKLSTQRLEETGG
jgi:5'(3')-deoxyribonucleotidase